jgi:tRNA dimethylallyltransferase
MRRKLIVIVGPTAVGKTAAAIKVARHFQTEIVSADSRQLFRELNIGTAKPSPEELAMVPHHFINSHSIHDPYDAAQYGREALERIQVLFTRHDYVVLCGGSGLYVQAVCDGFDEIPTIPASVREELTRVYHTEGIEVLQEKMRQLDPLLFQKMDQQNPHRLIRALEVVQHTGLSIDSFRQKRRPEHDFSIVRYGLELPRETLNQAIDERMDKMIARGLFAEAEQLYSLKAHNALQTVGYREIFDYMDGQYNQEEAVRLLKRNSRRYAKRQMTWFKRDAKIVWLNPANIEPIFALS